MSIVESALNRFKQEGHPVSVARPQASLDGGVRSRPDSMGEAPVVDWDGYPVIELSRRRLDEAGILIPNADESRFKAEYRAVKRRLLSSLQSSSGATDNSSVVMVASALPGEGKTFTSFNLASSLANEKDWLTVLVDADVARQHLTTSFGVSDRAGFMDVVADPLRSVREVLYRTSIPGLLFVPAGKSSDGATELMASARMKSVVNELLGIHPRTLVIFDSSPVLPTPESRALADVVGQIVMVIKAESTSRPDVEAAIKLLGERHNIGVLLNQFQGESPQSDYYGSYGTTAASGAPLAPG